jgi:Uma2 family endonuclease
MDRDSKDREDGWPRAPSHEEWVAMTPEAQAKVVESLPGEVTDAEQAMSEGELHSGAKIAAMQQLKGYFQRQGRSVYVVAELPVYYPDEDRFSPDVLAVLDVETHTRSKWFVDHEGKGLDWVLEVHVGGNRKKDALYNVWRYAQLGIPEYFILDRQKNELQGYRLKGPGRKEYVKMRPRGGRYYSRVLGLTLEVRGGELKFRDSQGRVLLGPEELAQKEARRRKRAEQRAAEEARRREQAEQRVAEEACRRKEAEQRVAEEACRRKEAEHRAAEEARQREQAEHRIAELQALLERFNRPG